MRLYLTCAFLVIAPTLTHAQDPGQAPDQPQGRAEARIARQTPKVIPKGRVIGHILCNDTRQPARGATVMLLQLPTKGAADPGIANGQSQSLFGRVGIDSTYAIDHVPSGDYAVLAFFPGYLSPMDDIVLAEDGGMDPEKAMRDKLATGEVIHVAAEGTQTADLTLERGATVSGRVLYSDGAPASQVTIELEDINAKPNPHPDYDSLSLGSMFRTIFTHQTLSTDDQGHFRVSGIHPGTYRVAVLQPFSASEMGGGGDSMSMAMGIGVFGGSGDPHSARFYSGDTFHKKSAKTYELRPGDTLADLDIRLPIDGFHEVSVHLAAVDGRPVNSASLTLTDTADDTIRFSSGNQGGMRDRGDGEIGNADGVYRFHSIPPGTYTLTASGASILASHMGRPDTTNFPKGFDATKMPDIPIVTSTTIFSDSTTTVIIKDSAPSDLNLTLTEAPKSTQPNPPPP